MPTDESNELLNTAADLGMRRAIVIPFNDFHGDGVGGILVGIELVSAQEFKNKILEKGTTLFAMAQVTHQRLKHKYMNGKELEIVQLSPRQKEIIEFLALGLSNKEIGFRLDITVATVSFHLTEIRNKLNIKSTREILPKSIALDIVEL